MKQILLIKPAGEGLLVKIKGLHYLLLLLAGLSAPFGFSPFHMPGITILSLALLFTALRYGSLKQSLVFGFVYGLGFFGFGVSWVIISIHDHGQMNYLAAGLITFLFIAYLSLFPAAVALVFKLFDLKKPLSSALLFAVLWCLSEYLRSNLMTGFPWLLMGVSQIDTPLKYLAPILGLYGLGLLSVFSSALLGLAMLEPRRKRYYFLTAFVLILITPYLLKNIHWTEIEKKSIKVAAVQGNLSMRDKWDERLFWKLLKYYEKETLKLLDNQLVILPESAIPLPATYLQDYLMNLNNKVLKANSALILGILKATDESEISYYNAVSAYGHAQGNHLKQHLVPFGEYIPAPFIKINKALNLPELNVRAGPPNQELIKIFNHPIANLICYEIAYPNILQQQMPDAEWIVSISDNGWFGHSLASYQQLQMAQMLSLLTGRFQILVNNDGLSSVIDTKGDVVESLPSFSSGILQNVLYPAHGSTPWIYWNEYPSIIFCLLCILFFLFHGMYQAGRLTDFN